MITLMSTRRPPPPSPSAIQAACLRHSLIIELGGRQGSVVRFLQPLIITDQQIDPILDIFAVALKTAVPACTAKNKNVIWPVKPRCS